MKLHPMLVSPGPLRPDSDRDAFEVKWDGFRALAQASPKAVEITSRNVVSGVEPCWRPPTCFDPLAT